MDSTSDSSDGINEVVEDAREVFPLISAVLALAIVFGNAFFSSVVNLTWPMVGMLVLVCFIPYIPELDWVQVGNMGGGLDYRATLRK